MADKKEYRSAIRSRKMIRQAFLELLKEKSFEKIFIVLLIVRRRKYIKESRYRKPL